MYLPLKLKLFIPLLVLSIASSILIFSLWLPHNHKLLMQDHHRILNVQLENISSTLSGMLLADDLGAFYSALDSLASHNEDWLDMKAYDEAGRLIYPLESINVEISESVHKQIHVIKYKQKKIGSIEVVADYSARHEELNNQAYQLLFILLGGFLLMAVVTSFSLKFFVLRPINVIDKAAKSISNGEYNLNMPNYSNDEIGNLAKRFSKMRDAIVDHQKKIMSEFEARQQAQIETKEKSDQILSILQNTSDAYISIDLEENILFLNEQAQLYFSLDAATVIGKNLWDNLPELSSYIYKAIHKTIKSNEPFDLEAFYPPADMWLAVHIFNCNKGVSISLRNITERKNIEQELRENERHQRAILENIADGILITNEQGKIISSNPAAEKIFGYTQTELKDSSVNSLMEYDVAAKHDGFLRSYQGHSEPVSIGVTSELVAKRKNNTLFPIEITVTKMLINDEVQLIAILRDVTERRKSEEQLRLADKIFESNNEGIVITDPSTGILRVNKAFLSITGYSEKEVLGEKIKLLASGRHDEHFYSEIWNCLKNEGHWKGEIWNRRKSGEIYPEWLSISPVYNQDNKVVNYVGIFSDITEKKEAEKRIFQMAHYDELTGVLNRAMFNIELSKEIQLTKNNLNSLAILYIDLDHFKKINDTFGHPIGDEVLCIIANRLTSILRGTDKVCRIGGDEFVVLLSNIDQIEHVSKIAKNIIEKLRLPIELNNRELFLGASIGVALYPQDAIEVDDLIRNADAALFMAKNSGRNNYQFYSNEMNAKASERLELESSLHRALDSQEFVLHYQPQIDLQEKKIIGVEALVRWMHPELGLVPPIDFIPVLEETGMIIPVGEWILFKACLQAKSWQEAGLGYIRIAVNISPHQFLYSDIVSTVDDALKISGLPAHLLELEITEGSIMTNTEDNIRLLQKFSDMGVKLSIDDFGTGYSSLAYLKRLPINTLKIDQSFVKNMHLDKNDENIVKAIISLGKSLDIRSIAEGVEEAEHLKQLEMMGCNEAQGYYISRPLSEDTLLSYFMKDLDIF